MVAPAVTRYSCQAYEAGGVVLVPFSEQLIRQLRVRSYDGDRVLTMSLEKIGDRAQVRIESRDDGWLERTKAEAYARGRAKGIRVCAAIAIAIALFWFCATARATSILWYTPPGFSVDAGGPGPCEGSIDPVPLTQMQMRGNLQSRTWRDSAAAIAGDPATFRRLWPIVRTEADVAVIRTKLGHAAVHDSMRIPLGLWLAAWLVAYKPTNGTVSCPTIKVQVPGTPPVLAMMTEALASAGALQVSPSPASSSATITLGAGEGPCSIEIFDIAGRRRLQMHWPFAIARTVVLDVASWPPGLYFVRARIGAQSYTQRLAVIR